MAIWFFVGSVVVAVIALASLLFLREWIESKEKQ